MQVVAAPSPYAHYIHPQGTPVSEASSIMFSNGLGVHFRACVQGWSHLACATTSAGSNRERHERSTSAYDPIRCSPATSDCQRQEQDVQRRSAASLGQMGCGNPGSHSRSAQVRAFSRSIRMYMYIRVALCYIPCYGVFACLFQIQQSRLTCIRYGYAQTELP